jgi:hypothetical protein
LSDGRDEGIPVSTRTNEKEELTCKQVERYKERTRYPHGVE